MNSPPLSPNARLAFWCVMIALVGLTLYGIRLRKLPPVTFYADSRNNDALKILFVGNSLTYYYDMPGMMVALSRQRLPKRELKVAMIAAGGVSLEGQRDCGVVERVLKEQGPWDYVVLQEQGGQTLFNAENAERAAKDLADLVRKAGAEPILFVDWCDPKTDGQKEPLLCATAKKLSIRSVPLFEVWDTLEREFPKLELLDPDRMHPSLVGSYVIACAFLAACGQFELAGLPTRFSHPAGTGVTVETAVPFASDKQAVDVQCRIRDLLRHQSRGG